jgi:predicted glycosyltransferase
MDLLKTQVPALLVPYADAGENEQTKRALKLEKLGAVRVLPETELTTDNLIREIDSLLLFSTNPISMHMDGASKSCDIILLLLNKLTAHSKEYCNVV